MAKWLRAWFPGITPAAGWHGQPCWIAFMMTRDAEHNPPFYWLGRALDTVDEGGASDLLRLRLHAAHGPHACAGDARDAAVQDVLSEACAFAWAAQALGVPSLVPATEDPAAPEPALVHVMQAGAWIAPERLRPQRTMQDVLQSAVRHIDEAEERLPAARTRIVYVDTWHDPMYAQGVGYRLELTEPLEHTVHHYATGRSLGYVLTRPFQWGNALASHY